ncbi:Carbon starvation protein, predicted membrane protein, partial [human gut metagenome]
LFWLIIILAYYFIATFISIDAIIGKIYPLFGICLIIMAVGVIFGIFTNPAYTIPEIWETSAACTPPTPSGASCSSPCLRCYLRLPLHPVASDGSLHEE